MQNKAPSFAPKRAGSKPAHKIAGFVMLFAWTCITPALFGQRDVHAALKSSANRKPAPAFQLVTDTGGKVRISDYRGRVVLLNFWATACGGCVLEIPSFNRD
jgi:thiol-disulfide isomerase/thioredoxin